MKRLEYVRCPLCATTNPIFAPKRAERGLSPDFEWVDFSGKTTFIQIREGGGKVGTGKKGRGRGKGYGFPMIDSYTFEEVVNSHLKEYGGLVDSLKDAVIELVKELKSLGVISDADLK